MIWKKRFEIDKIIEGPLDFIDAWDDDLTHDGATEFLMDNDEISAEEEGFIRGFNEAG